MGVLNTQMYSVVVVMAVGTSLMAGPMMVWAMSHAGMGEDEAARLEREAAMAKSIVRRLKRVLLATRGGANSRMGARLLALLNKSQALEATAFFAAGGGATGDGELKGLDQCYREAGGPGCKLQKASGKDAAQAILAEAEKVYDLIVLGACEGNPAGPVDAVMQNAPCPTLMVRAPSWTSAELRHILVPTAGTDASSQAVELAAVLAAAAGARLTVLHVAQRLENQELQELEHAANRRAAQEIADSQAELARKLGAAIDVVVMESRQPEAEILKAARDMKYDLIVLSSTVRPVSGRVFFGSVVENVLLNAACVVAVLSA
jgi:nucleotide-binding universal stress UspA family protein